jgi:LPS-assembly protein
MMGSDLHVMSDKAYRRMDQGQFEAVGNVVIIHQSKALYGERAVMSMESGDVEVAGNVRYVAPEMTMYGTDLFYNTNSTYLLVKNARVVTENFIVLGETLARVNRQIIIGNNAEYTTCQDCPESWSVFGSEVHITLGRYIRIRSAYIKVNGIVMMYLPYLILPIKKGRETGLLFPKLSFNTTRGTSFQQPFFWVLSPQTDMTFTPSVWGHRGIGNELQARHLFGEQKWVELNSLQASDRLYDPYRLTKPETELSGKHRFRSFSTYEHRFVFGNHTNHHLYYSMESDLDTIRDFDDFAGDRVYGSETGGGGFIEYRSPSFGVGFESYYHRNRLVEDPNQFDHSYVQILPRINFAIPPISVYNGDGLLLHNVSLGGAGDATIFKQNHKLESSYIRNAHRLNGKTYLDINWNSLGPISLLNNIMFDSLYYYFPYEKGDREFFKRGFVLTSEATVSLFKVYGLSYKTKVPLSELRSNPNQKRKPVETGKDETADEERESTLVGSIPELSELLASSDMEISKSSYAHHQEYKFKHYYLSNQRSTGNTRFRNQIESSAGQFDSLDVLKERLHQVDHQAYLTAIPLSNSLEFQWNNYLMRKTSSIFNEKEDGHHQRNKFSYGRIAYFTLSQGYDFNANAETMSNWSGWRDSLTRLYLSSGVSLGKTSISASEYYFYNGGKHLFSASLSRSFDRMQLSSTFSYDSVSSNPVKNMYLSADIKPSDLISLSFRYNYDLATNRPINSSYGLVYSPPSNCWRVALGYTVSDIESGEITYNLLINYSEKGFTEFGN